MATQDILSPYSNLGRERSASAKTLVMGNDPDTQAVDGLPGQGDDPAFNRWPTNDGQRQINASSKADLMAQIGAIRKNAQSAGGLKQADVDQKAAQERWADFKAAYRNTADSCESHN